MEHEVMIEDYIEFKAHPFADDLHFIINKLFNRIHGVISKEKLNLGLSFPTMTSGSPGDTLRVFGKIDDLKAVTANEGIQHLVDRRFVGMSHIMKIPDDSAEVAYIRVRKSEKITASAVKRKIRRLQKRAMARGEPWDQTVEKQISQKMRENQGRGETHPYLLIQREGELIPIFIQKIFLTTREKNENPIFNRYGLGNGSPKRVNAVYDF